ncbi:phosphatidate cytidylyltransferase [Grosmannia clavigera kw1407]|uniref:dolichol kinase n=1 Tax=Grosmannia clavigera (strain kw1407 / UAMH 11150) TaxID=655863 RepID=F0XEN3_GROCL|nr:phosphatidate cytidylyltransferase [Grosmannia clavigera kw1407]EFX04558.1 phosphatidate cytidylyltransferase [Grosmannia clavigera kw1407]
MQAADSKKEDETASDHRHLPEALVDHTTQQRWLSRSPHPYHRNSTTLLHASDRLASLSPSRALRPRSQSESQSQSHFRTQSQPHVRSRPHSRSRSPAHPENAPPSYRYARQLVLSTPASDSGSEADDEHFLKGLPAPKARPHKGLRGMNESWLSSSGLSTPLLSPALLRGDTGCSDGGNNQDRRRLRQPLVHSELADIPAHLPGRDSAVRSRRGREIVRRSTELLLLVVLGSLLCSHPDARPLIVRWRRELRATLAVVVGLCAVYPLRVAVWTYRERQQRQGRGDTSADSADARRPLLYVPASFDPAPLLYPLAIPVFVSLLLATPTLATAPLLNLSLALCTIPRPLVPLALRGELCASVQWVLSCVPMMVAQRQQQQQQNILSAETATLLYPLHQNLCWLLQALTTTSLLPAELQLLSTGLINLLLLAASPQAVILQAVLWGGGLGLLATCSMVIRWGVTLARVPRWRFRREMSGSGGGGSSNSGVATAGGWPLISPMLVLVRWIMAELAVTRRARLEMMFGPGPVDDELDDGTNSDDYKFSQDAAMLSSAAALQLSDSDGGKVRLKRKRRRELPAEKGSSLHTAAATAIGLPTKTHTPSGRPKRAMSSSVRAYFSLTQAQAGRRRWLYAGYVYGCIVAMILGPIRLYVSERALQGHEAVGWAMGYLLGDVDGFRLEVVKAGLEYWVCLPTRTLSSACHRGWVEQVRLGWLGAAGTRLVLLGYWLGILVVGLAVVLRLSPVYEVDTRRKVFHFMMVAMLLPATFVDPAYVALALALVLAVFLLLDLLRASQLPPLSRPIATFLTPYVDGRDLRGPVVISHIFLLIGCAIPLWLSLGSLGRVGGGGNRDAKDCSTGWELPTRDVSMVAGVVCVGLGDAAASLIGRRWGRRKWLWGGGKSLEGSVAFATAVFAGLMVASFWLRLGRWPVTGEEGRGGGPGGGPLVLSLRTLRAVWSRSLEAVPRAGMCASVASLTEAVLTGGNDNVVVPVILWTCVKSVGL